MSHVNALHRCSIHIGAIDRRTNIKQGTRTDSDSNRLRIASAAPETQVLCSEVAGYRTFAFEAGSLNFIQDQWAHLQLGPMGTPSARTDRIPSNMVNIRVPSAGTDGTAGGSGGSCPENQG